LLYSTLAIAISRAVWCLVFAEHWRMGIGEDACRHGAVLLGHQRVSDKNSIIDQG